MNRHEQQQRYYTAGDFYRIKKIDAHVHLNTANPALPEQAIADNFSVISINTKIPGFPSLREQQQLTIKQREKFRDTVFYLSSFDAEEVINSNNCSAQLAYLEESIGSGASGVKIWKDIGMVIMRSPGEYLMPDDDVLQPIFQYLQKNKVTVCGHIGEPKNCWLPLEEMTTINDRNYFSNHPEYHMYLHPECPAYEALIDARDNLLEKNQDLCFVGAHLASLEWSFEELSKRLDRFPLMAVDIAERIGQIQYQSIENRQKVVDFFISYQDRVIYGTDFIAAGNDNPSHIKTRAHDLWVRDWKYFTSDEEMESPYVKEKIRGLKLPAGLIDKFYYQNAANCYLSR